MGGIDKRREHMAINFDLTNTNRLPYIVFSEQHASMEKFAVHMTIITAWGIWVSYLIY